MTVFPILSVSPYCGGLLLAAYFLSLTLSALSYPRDKRKKLFVKPAYPQGDWRRWVRLAGTVAAIVFVVTMFFARLQTGTPWFYVGLAIYVLGLVLVMVSLREFRTTPVDRPVMTGVYHVTRNPQWIGLALVYLGATFAVATWFHLALWAVIVLTYHLQILLEEELCLRSYGDEYAVYLKQVHRYVRF
jgi:protein-S-isoprenylcysteine O-methyltransferase Ste14